MTDANIQSKNYKAEAGRYLTFALKGETYGVPIEAVREIIGIAPITPIPNTPQFIKGVINLRGKIVPIVDLRRKFNFDSQEYDKETCIIVIDVEQAHIGVIVDTVCEVVDFDREHVESAPAVASNENEPNPVIGMGKHGERVIILVDLTLALSKEHISKIIQTSPNIAGDQLKSSPAA